MLLNAQSSPNDVSSDRRVGVQAKQSVGLAESNRGLDIHEGQIEGVVFRPIKRYSDDRGWLVELHRNDELPSTLQPVMSYVSETLPGVARGPHEHVHQTDYFVFLGPGEFEVYLWDHRPDSPTCGIRTRKICGTSNPMVVIIPPGVVHAYKNVSTQPGWVINLPNQLYAGEGKQDPVDEIRHEDDRESPYQID